MTAPLKKRCKACRKNFTPERPMQTTCSFDCAIAHSKKPKAKKAYIFEGKKELAKKYPDKSKLLKKAQTVVNKYVRLRDKNKPCISCGTANAKWDAGHFKSSGGHQQLRFNTLNIHKQCMRCNQYLSGNLVPYEEELIKKIGKSKVDQFKSKKERGNYKVEYLERLVQVFNKKIRLYERLFR
jgi:hypothetical protein